MVEKLKKTIKLTTGKRGVANLTIVQKCDCKNQYQDKIYGKGIRIKNSCHSGHRCTVCGK